jgi:hypothetical protein
MTPLDWIKALLGKGLVEPVADYYKRKQELKQAKFEAQLKFEQAKGDRQAQLIREGLAADANWEMEFARQAAASWKDEYTLLVVSIPAVLAFMRTKWLDGPQIVADGFAALAATPTWYQILLCSMFGATVGIRWWRRTQSDT